MSASENGVCLQAIACLKAKSPESQEPSLTLTYPDWPISTDLGNGLCVTYLLERGDDFIDLRNRDRDVSGVSDEDIHAASVRNLVSLAQERLTIQSYGQVYAAFLGGNFEASLILADSLWDESLARLAPNGFVAAIPARDILAFCDANSPEGIAELRQLIERLENPDHPISQQLYHRVKKGWAPFQRH